MKWYTVSLHSPLCRWLAAERRGNVFSVHRRAINLVLDGRSVTLVDPKRGDGPDSLVVVGPGNLADLGWKPDDPVRCAGGYLHSGRGAAVVWSGARPWVPPVPPEVATPASLRETAQRLAAVLMAANDGRGLLPAALRTDWPWSTPSYPGTGGQRQWPCHQCWRTAPHLAVISLGGCCWL